eukprot:scaffold140857_cov31-Tisochrysis_lutea.AAC.2
MAAEKTPRMATSRTRDAGRAVVKTMPNRNGGSTCSDSSVGRRLRASCSSAPSADISGPSLFSPPLSPAPQRGSQQATWTAQQWAGRA